MKLSRKSLLYTAYIIAITGFFLYYLFPSDTLKRYLEYRLSEGNPDIAVSIDRVSPAFPPGIKLHQVGIAHLNESLIDLENLKLMPAILSLFSDKTTVNFKGRVNTGTVSGRAQLNGNSGAQTVKIGGRISGVQVQGIPALQRIPADKISGVLNGDFAYANAGPNRSLSGELNLAQCRIELKNPLFSLKSLEFKGIDADLELRNEILDIKSSSARGNQLDADITGTIALKDRTGKNALDLSISVTPHHLLLAKIEKTIPLDLLRQQKAGKDAISFKVNGTWDKPDFSLN